MPHEHRTPPSRTGAFLILPGLDVLSTEQFDMLACALSKWRNQTKGKRAIASRNRLYLVFLVLRHAGASLGEALAINDLEDFAPVPWGADAALRSGKVDQSGSGLAAGVAGRPVPGALGFGASDVD